MREGYASCERRTEGCSGFGPGRISCLPKGAAKSLEVGDLQRYSTPPYRAPVYLSVDIEISGTGQESDRSRPATHAATIDRL